MEREKLAALTGGIVPGCVTLVRAPYEGQPRSR
jgi:hypothetical protein